MRKITLSIMMLVAWLFIGCGKATQVGSTPVAVASITNTPAYTPTPVQTPTPPRRFLMAQISSLALAGNRLDDSPKRDLYIYLPPSYFSSEKRYPVVYYLPGFEEEVIHNFSLPKDMDRLIAAESVKEMILIIAPGNNSLGGSFYINSPVAGNWEDFIVKEVVSYVDANYRTLASPASRGLAGFSMGGFGALNLGMLHPDVFGAVYSLSPGLFDPNGLSESQMFSRELDIRNYLNFVQSLQGLSDQEALQRIKSSSLNFTLAYGVAFSPDEDGTPPYIAYPYQESTGQLTRDDVIWQTWEAGFGGIPEELVQYHANWLRLKAIALNYGVQDEYAWIPKGCAYFVEQMQLAGIPLQVSTFKGGHVGPFAQRFAEGVLPFFSSQLAFE